MVDKSSETTPCK